MRFRADFQDRPPEVFLTVDVEPDCPPYLSSWRGVTEGLPRLLDLLASEEVAATFFVTGQTAERFPEAVRELVTAGHELGCHGHSHERFGTMNRTQAELELAQASAVLRKFGPTTAFRAPNLDLPDAFPSPSGRSRVRCRLLRGIPPARPQTSTGDPVPT